ncbi:MAG: aminotransferase class I/II-fold pyridoxal phosphate-dependent enzyme, partial [Victivallaceae bacterium]|nr:aminotransferase class I/II-fold pyridoxal phosphate-dependent enzyme [Victivallaceae bacterium]
MVSDKKIFVTQPSLPDLEEFLPYLKEIWKEKWLTNNGRFHQEFEKALAEYLGVEYVSLFCNGTSALQIGLQALRITGEVITTPFTFAATTHSIYWNACASVFCDIDPVTLNLNPEKVESLITPQTTAILPVHVFGNPCDVVKLKSIADSYGLKLFYDAAHAFGVEVDGTSILN